MVAPDGPLDEFLRGDQPKCTVYICEALTVIVNRLYGKILGIRLKKLSLYSLSTMALRATRDSNGFSVCGNLPLTAQFSFEIASLSSSMRASSSGGNAF